MKIGVIGKISKIKEEKVVTDLMKSLQEWGYESVRFASHSQIEGVDAVVVLGGDGAILHAAVVAAQKGVKVIGVNYGHLGFLTEYERGEEGALKGLLDQLKKEECRIMRRSLLEISVKGKTFYALNEVAIQRDYAAILPTGGQMLTLRVDVGEGSNVLLGDGLLMCTPTGSTAYSLSAGGAILSPQAPVVMMTPICPFSFNARSTVFPDTDCFSVTVEKGSALVLIDGKTVAPLVANQQITIKKAPFTADFPLRDGFDFMGKIRNKLNK